MNLTQTSQATRKAINIVVTVVIVYLIGYLSFPIAKDVFRSVFPEKEEENTMYGKLPQIKFSPLAISSEATPEYVLNTADGRLPNITPELVSVYKVIKPQLSFSSGKVAQTNIALLGFDDNNRVSDLKGSTFTWADRENSRNLEINISTGNLDYKVDLVSQQASFFQSSDIALKDPAEKGRGLLRSLGFFKDELYGRGEAKITFGEVAGDRVNETTTPIRYNFARVDYFRTIYQVPIYGPKFDEGLLHVTFANSANEKLETVGVYAHEWSIDTDTFGRYPPIGVIDAWKEVSANRGVISKVKLRNGSVFREPSTVAVSKIFIEKVSLGYYDSDKVQDYMQPIYVFEGTFQSSEGDGTIAIYYPAVNPAYFN